MMQDVPCKRLYPGFCQGTKNEKVCFNLRVLPSNISFVIFHLPFYLNVHSRLYSLLFTVLSHVRKGMKTSCLPVVCLAPAICAFLHFHQLLQIFWLLFLLQAVCFLHLSFVSSTEGWEIWNMGSIEKWPALTSHLHFFL